MLGALELRRRGAASLSKRCSAQHLVSSSSIVQTSNPLQTSYHQLRLRSVPIMTCQAPNTLLSRYGLFIGLFPAAAGAAFTAAHAPGLPSISAYRCLELGIWLFLYKLGAPFVGVPVIRALLFGVYIKASDVGTIPFRQF